MERKLICNFIAYTIYFPLSRTALFIEKIGFNVSNFPLSGYRHKPFYQSKNDALDRFGTRLEKRFSKDEIRLMLERAGFRDIRFSFLENFFFLLTSPKKKFTLLFKESK